MRDQLAWQIAHHHHGSVADETVTIDELDLSDLIGDEYPGVWIQRVDRVLGRLRIAPQDSLPERDRCNGWQREPRRSSSDRTVLRHAVDISC